MDPRIICALFLIVLLSFVSSENNSSQEYDSNEDGNETNRTTRSIGNIARLLLGGNVPPDHPLVKYPDPIYSASSSTSNVIAAVPGMTGARPSGAATTTLTQQQQPVTANAAPVPVFSNPSNGINNNGYPPVQNNYLTIQQQQQQQPYNAPHNGFHQSQWAHTQPNQQYPPSGYQAQTTNPKLEATSPAFNTQGNSYNPPPNPYSPVANSYQTPGNPYNAQTSPAGFPGGHFPPSGLPNGGNTYPANGNSYNSPGGQFPPQAPGHQASGYQAPPQQYNYANGQTNQAPTNTFQAQASQGYSGPGGPHSGPVNPYPATPNSYHGPGNSNLNVAPSYIAPVTTNYIQQNGFSTQAPIYNNPSSSYSTPSPIYNSQTAGNVQGTINYVAPSSGYSQINQGYNSQPSNYNPPPPSYNPPPSSYSPPPSSYSPPPSSYIPPSQGHNVHYNVPPPSYKVPFSGQNLPPSNHNTPSINYNGPSSNYNSKPSNYSPSSAGRHNSYPSNSPSSSYNGHSNNYHASPQNNYNSPPPELNNNPPPSYSNKGHSNEPFISRKPTNDRYRSPSPNYNKQSSIYSNEVSSYSNPSLIVATPKRRPEYEKSSRESNGNKGGRRPEYEKSSRESNGSNGGRTRPKNSSHTNYSGPQGEYRSTGTTYKTFKTDFTSPSKQYTSPKYTSAESFRSSKTSQEFRSTRKPEYSTGSPSYRSTSSHRSPKINYGESHKKSYSKEDYRRDGQVITKPKTQAYKVIYSAPTTTHGSSSSKPRYQKSETLKSTYIHKAPKDTYSARQDGSYRPPTPVYRTPIKSSPSPLSSYKSSAQKLMDIYSRETQSSKYSDPPTKKYLVEGSKRTGKALPFSSKKDKPKPPQKPRVPLSQSYRSNRGTDNKYLEGFKPLQVTRSSPVVTYADSPIDNKGLPKINPKIVPSVAVFHTSYIK